jgi:peroxiredoxin
MATLALAFGCITATADTRTLIGKPAPDFALRAIGGPNLRMSEHRGEVVVIAFWSSRCNPCRDSLKELNALNANWSTAGLTVIGVNVDDNAQAARDYAGSLAVAYPLLLDPTKQVARAYRIEALPNVVVIDREGLVRSVRLDEKVRPAPGQDFASRLRKLLDE